MTAAIPQPDVDDLPHPSFTRMQWAAVAATGLVLALIAFWLNPIQSLWPTPLNAKPVVQAASVAAPAIVTVPSPLPQPHKRTAAHKPPASPPAQPIIPWLPWLK